MINEEILSIKNQEYLIQEFSRIANEKIEIHCSNNARYIVFEASQLACYKLGYYYKKLHEYTSIFYSNSECKFFFSIHFLALISNTRRH